MTDLQRHLKGIRKILNLSMDSAKHSGNYDIQLLKEQFRQFLPKSYGIGSGIITGDTGISKPVQLLLYDVPRAGGIYPNDALEFRIEHVLFVLDSAFAYDLQMMEIAIETMQSVKKLQTFREPGKRITDAKLGQKRRIIPKDRLPFTLIYGERFLPDERDNISRIHSLWNLLDRYSHEYQPEQIDLLANHIQYLNPLLEFEQANSSDISISQTPDLKKPALCYICKSKYFRPHFHYDQLCLQCGDLNYRKRVEVVDLTGYRFLVTGARIKIGYYTAMRLLRAGADVIVTTRFPRDAAGRYSKEPDFESWCDHLHIYGLDLRQVGYVQDFIVHLNVTYPHLDGIINNAAQTVRRPPAFYAHLIAGETAPITLLSKHEQNLLAGDVENTVYLQPSIAGQLTAGENDPNFPHGQFDEHGQQVDNREHNSWVMRLEEISPAEIAEVQLVNAIAPAILTGQLKPLMQKSPHKRQFVVNVSAAEGRFAQYKNGFHPHTNMAKAALNMLTRSIADHYAQDSIYVTSVDPGWVSDQVPRTNDASRDVGNDHLPIDMVDAAARICDPIHLSIAHDTHHAGVLLKDYMRVDW